MPLISAKPILSRQLEQILYKAAYEAHLTQTDTSGIEEKEIKNKIQKDAEKAAKKFATKFRDESANKIADAIHNYVMSITIMATPSGSLISTSIYTPSPVTGVIPPNDFKVS